MNLNWEQKCRLTQSDPVTCARHFDYQFNQFLSNFLMSNVSPLGSISDWFYRVEYQQRGSPHIHMLLWIKNAPIFGIDDDNEVISFIDSIITCQKPSGNLNLITLVNRQIHRHSHWCRKRKKMNVDSTIHSLLWKQLRSCILLIRTLSHTCLNIIKKCRHVLRKN